jgi:hypothetical protein
MREKIKNALVAGEIVAITLFIGFFILTKLELRYIWHKIMHGKEPSKKLIKEWLR